MAAGFRKVRKYFDMLDLNGDRVIDMREFTSQVGAYVPVVAAVASVPQHVPRRSQQLKLCML
jgi:hypothetical protein